MSGCRSSNPIILLGCFHSPSSGKTPRDQLGSAIAWIGTMCAAICGVPSRQVVAEATGMDAPKHADLPGKVNLVSNPSALRQSTEVGQSPWSLKQWSADPDQMKKDLQCLAKDRLNHAKKWRSVGKEVGDENAALRIKDDEKGRRTKPAVYRGWNPLKYIFRPTTYRAQEEALRAEVKSRFGLAENIPVTASRVAGYLDQQRLEAQGTLNKLASLWGPQQLFECEARLDKWQQQVQQKLRELPGVMCPDAVGEHQQGLYEQTQDLDEQKRPMEQQWLKWSGELTPAVVETPPASNAQERFKRIGEQMSSVLTSGLARMPRRPVAVNRYPA